MEKEQILRSIFLACKFSDQCRAFMLPAVAILLCLAGFIGLICLIVMGYGLIYRGNKTEVAQIERLIGKLQDDLTAIEDNRAASNGDIARAARVREEIGSARRRVIVSDVSTVVGMVAISVILWWLVHHFTRWI